MDKVACTPAQIKEICLEAMPLGIDIGVDGPPGVAKSATGCSLAAEFERRTGEPWKTVMFNCAYHEPTDVAGIPFVREGRAHFAITDIWPTTPNNIIVIEEVTKGPKLIQNALGELVHERKLRGYNLPDNTYFYFSWNRRQDGAGDAGILSHIANRMMTLHMKVDPDGFCEYAIAQKWDPMVIAYLNQNKHMVFDEKTFSSNGTKFNSDQPAFASPRSWEKAQRIVSVGMRTELEMAALSGIIGEGPTREFIAYKELCKELPDINVCIRSPKTAPLPKDMSVMYALVLSLVYATDDKNAGNVVEYIKRMRKDFQVLWVKSLSSVAPRIFGNNKDVGSLVNAVGKSII